MKKMDYMLTPSLSPPSPRRGEGGGSVGGDVGGGSYALSEGGRGHIQAAGGPLGAAMGGARRGCCSGAKAREEGFVFPTHRRRSQRASYRARIPTGKLPVKRARRTAHGRFCLQWRASYPQGARRAAQPVTCSARVPRMHPLRKVERLQQRDLLPIGRDLLPIGKDLLPIGKSIGRLIWRDL